MTSQNRWKSCCSLVLGGLMLMLVGAGRATAADALASLFGDPVIARGKNVEVKRSALDDAFIAYRANLASRGDDVPEDQRLAKETSLLERLILTQILTSMASTSDKTNSAVLAKKFLDEARKAAGDTEESFERQLRSLGLNKAQFTARVEEQSLVESVLERELRSGISISDENVRKFYSENQERFQQPETVRGMHIIIYTRDPETGRDLGPDDVKVKRERAQRAQIRGKAGEDFMTLIKEYSEDPKKMEKKGEFLISRINRFPEIETAAFTLPINGVSDVVSTPNAMHILKVLEKRPAKLMEFDAAKDDIRKYLGHRELEKKLPDYFAKLKADAKLEVLDSKYRQVLEKTSPNALSEGLGR